MPDNSLTTVAAIVLVLALIFGTYCYHFGEPKFIQKLLSQKPKNGGIHAKPNKKTRWFGKRKHKGHKGKPGDTVVRIDHASGNRTTITGTVVSHSKANPNAKRTHRRR